MEYLSIGRGIVRKAPTTLYLERDMFYCLHKYENPIKTKSLTKFVCSTNLFHTKHKQLGVVMFQKMYQHRHSHVLNTDMSEM